MVYLNMFGCNPFAACLALALSIPFGYTAPAVGAVVEERAVADQAVTKATIFYPPTSYTTPRTLYGRTAQLADGTLLATW
jgi:hypothetical protein